jgi:selenophosphate synthetase-related protein
LVAEAGLCQTAKDVSNGGIIGTISLLCEYSGRGALLMLDAIPRPPQMELMSWLKAFLSYGFILCVEEPSLPLCLEAFHRKGIAAQVIGEIREERRIILHSAGEEEVLFDFSRESITGIPHRES